MNSSSLQTHCQNPHSSTELECGISKMVEHNLLQVLTYFQLTTFQPQDDHPEFSTHWATEKCKTMSRQSGNLQSCSTQLIAPHMEILPVQIPQWEKQTGASIWLPHILRLHRSLVGLVCSHVTVREEQSQPTHGHLNIKCNVPPSSQSMNAESTLVEMAMPSSFTMVQCLQEYRTSRLIYCARMDMGKSQGARPGSVYI